MGIYNDRNTSKQDDDDDDSDSSPHSSPSSQTNSFNSSGFSYPSGYQHSFGHYGGVQYAPQYSMEVTTPKSAKSPVVSSPSTMSSHFMFGNAYNSIYTSQSSYGNYQYLGLNNGVPASSGGSKDSKNKEEGTSSQEGNGKPFNASGEGNAKPQSKSPKSLLT